MTPPREVWVVSSPGYGSYSVLDNEQDARDVLDVVKRDDESDDSVITRYTLPTDLIAVTAEEMAAMEEADIQYDMGGFAEPWDSRAIAYMEKMEGMRRTLAALLARMEVRDA